MKQTEVLNHKNVKNIDGKMIRPLHYCSGDESWGQNTVLLLTQCIRMLC